MQIKNRNNLTILTMIVVVGGLMATLSTTITSMPIARAQGQGPPPPGVLQGPPTFVGNPTGLSTGPPVPNCNAIDQGNFHGPPDDTRLGCK
jgi:hypothetical protein